MGIVSCDENGLGGQGEAEAKIGELFILAESTGSRIINTTDLALKDPDLAANGTTTIDGANVTKTGNDIVIDYGTGTAGSDGILREGQVSLTMSGGSDYMVAGTSVDGTFNNYKEAGKPVSGTFKVDNQGNDVFGLELTQLSVTDEDDNGFTLNATKTLSWDAGLSTLSDVSDDEYTLSGTSSGTADTLSVTANITSPFIYKGACQYRVEEGVLSITLESSTPNVPTYTSGSIDFLSEDNCNNLYEIKLQNDDGGEVITTQTFSGF